jgi:site-specific DNA-methyltransferase (adenine-specific)
MSRQFLGGKVTLHGGDSREVLATLETASVDSVVCDPPYALVASARGSTPGSVEASQDVFKRVKAGGFMGKAWDTGETAFAAEFWREVLRVLKPGGHLVAFSGTRTYHRLACAIEDAGFEIRDQLAWAYGSGFPKSHNLAGGLGTALKPAWEPIVLARKPLIGTVAANVLAHGTGAINVDGCRIETSERAALRRDERLTDDGWGMSGGGTGSGATHDLGRWPANLLLDGSEEVVALFPETGGGGFPQKIKAGSPIDFRTAEERPERINMGDFGSAARFFYTSKADADDRLGSKHPTVKPVDLMQWLVRLVTPKGGTCLDPFAGTGTTGEAAWREGMRAILIEREEEYQADIARRMELAQQPTKRAAVAKTKNRLDCPSSLPLFSMEASRGGA